VGGRNKQIKPRSYCAGAQIGKLAKWAKVCISGRLISRAKPWAQSVERSAARKAKKEILWVAKQEVCHTQSASSQETSRDEMVWDGMGVLGGWERVSESPSAKPSPHPTQSPSPGLGPGTFQTRTRQILMAAHQ